MFGERNPSIFDKMLPEVVQDTSDSEDLDTKFERTFSRIKRKAPKRERRRRKKGNTSWNPKLGESFNEGSKSVRCYKRCD